MNDAYQKPDPDRLLKQIEDETKEAQRGKLKIFFGSCPGVGKTYAMLQAAHQKLKQGRDVVAGIVETHKRPETEKILEGIPSLPPLVFTHRGLTLTEFDLDATIARHPDIVLVDELAHTNAPSMRHPKRWNDIEELLDAGIDVYTTLNVQHIESLSDIVAGTTGVVVKETIPDSVFDAADDIILVDINADELLKRLQEGKVYIAPDARTRAVENFFRERNLIALREIALRRTAERVDAQMYALPAEQGANANLPIAEKIMVCIGPEPLSLQLVRTAKRTAASLKAPWIAVYVENLRHYGLNKAGRDSVKRIARMAERLGGKSVAIQGDNVVDDIISYAKANHVTKIIIGKPIKQIWKTLLYGSLADKIIRKSDHIDVYVVTGKPNADETHAGKSDLAQFRYKLYGGSLAAVAMMTAFGIVMGDGIRPIDQALVYLMGVVLVAAKLGRGPSFLYSVLSVTCFNFFFIPPLYSFDISDRSYWLTFIVMLITSVVITSQASRLRLQALHSRKREHDTQIFYMLTRELASTRVYEAIATVAAKYIVEMFDVTTVVTLPDGKGRLQPLIGELPSANIAKEEGVMHWCFDNNQVAGRGTMTMPTAVGLYFPLIASSGALGVLGIIPHQDAHEFSGDEMSSLETCANLLASALERAKSSDIAEKSKIEAESEKLRTMLLSSVSHDLRSPLASITGAASTIATDADNLSSPTVRELGRSIHKEAERLSRLVSNLLEVTRIESDTVQLNKQPYFIEELIGSALAGLAPILSKHHVMPKSDEDLPLVMVDGVLIEQVLINLLENAVHYTAPGSLITIYAVRSGSNIQVSVKDNGPGIAAGQEKKIFDKFTSISRNDVVKGTGLGLAICAGIVKAHHGEIWAENPAEGGACFTFTLPITESVRRDSNALHD